MKLKYVGKAKTRIALGDKILKFYPGDKVNIKKSDYDKITDKDLFEKEKKKSKTGRTKQ